MSVGDLIEVEVEEAGRVEWRKALVTRMLRSGRGRFEAIVYHADGEHPEAMLLRTAPEGPRIPACASL